MWRCWDLLPARPASQRRRCISIAILMIVADGYAREVLNVTPDDVFVGSPPLAFTFGLGGLAIFRCGSAPPRRCWKMPRPPDGQDYRDLQGHDLLHLADGISGDDGCHGQGRRSFVVASGGISRRDLAGAGVRPAGPAGPARPSSTALARPNCCTSSSPTGSAMRSLERPESRLPAIRRRSSTTT